MQFNYHLNAENIKEWNAYAAMRDTEVRRKLISLMVSLSVLVLTLCLWSLGFNGKAYVLTAFGLLLIVLLFPRLYWKIVFDRIDQAVDQKPMSYPEVEVKIGSQIEIVQQGQPQTISLTEVEGLDFTRSSCLIFYRSLNRRQTLIIPNAVIGSQMEALIEIMKERNTNAEKR